MGILVEVVACSVSDCLAIERAGADRIELCSGIVAGGVTPSTGLLRACLTVSGLPIMAMVRPREGGFCYSDHEFGTMIREAEALLEAGAHGLVFGILHEDGRIDAERMKAMVHLAGRAPVMCHRAFDVTPDPFAALEALIDCGVSRVLTSGQTKDILGGLDVIEKLLERAGRRIEVQPCEGIRPGNVQAVLDRLFTIPNAPRALHFGPFASVTDPTSDLGRPVTYGSHLAVEEDTVRGVVDIVRALR
jgi:copper homeostasis protein